MTDTTLIQRLRSAWTHCNWRGDSDKVMTEAADALEQQAAPSVAPEPVAWLSIDCIGERYLCFSKPMDNDPVTPLFAHPPRAPLLERKGVLIVSDQDLRCVIADLTSECKTLRAAASEALQAMEMHANQYPHMQKGYTVDAIAMLRQVLDKGAD